MHNPFDGLEPNKTVNVVGQIPSFVIALHRLARLGKAPFYGGTQKQFVEFDLTTEEGLVLAQKFPALAGVDRVFMIYREHRICL